jgi:hypothetical protein
LVGITLPVICGENHIDSDEDNDNIQLE